MLLIAALAGFMVDRMRRLSEKETTSRILLLAILPAMLVVIQPDLGSGMVYLAIACSILFVAGTKWTHFVAIGTITAAIVLGVLVGAPAAGVHVLKQYQVDRLTAFVNPTDDPRRQGYQLRQSQVAIGRARRRAAAPTRRPRPSSTSSPSTTPTSCSAWWARSSDSWGRRWCCPSTRS